MSRRGWLLFCAMGVIWGIPYLLIRVAVREIDPPTLVFARSAPAALLLLPLAAHRGFLRPLLARWRWIVLFAVVEMAVPWLLLSSAEQHVTSSTAGLLIAGVPLIAAVLYPLFRHTERLDQRRIVGLLVGFAGVAALVGIDVRGSNLLAVAEIGVVAIGYSLGPLVVARRLPDLPSLGVVSVALGLTALVYLPVAATHRPTHLSAEVIWAVVGLAFVCSALAFLLFFALIAEVGPARSTVITYVNPAVAVVLGVALLGEPFTAGMAVGFPLILIGSVLATGRGARQPRLERTS
jgi:drug/metabolite transporter (DMT)-like permease